MSIVDTNPKLRLHADINRLAREHGVIEDVGLALRNLYREVPEPTTEQKITVKLKELRRLLGDDVVKPLIDRATSLYRLPVQPR